MLFNGSVFLNGGTLDLNGFDIGFDSLYIGGNSIIDFGSGVASNFTLGDLELANGVTLTITNWIDGNDLFITSDWLNALQDQSGSTPMNQVIFNGFSGNDTIWNSINNEIAPIVPEPSTYGAVLMGLSLAGWLARRRPRTL